MLSFSEFVLLSSLLTTVLAAAVSQSDHSRRVHVPLTRRSARHGSLADWTGWASRERRRLWLKYSADAELHRRASGFNLYVQSSPFPSKSGVVLCNAV